MKLKQPATLIFLAMLLIGCEKNHSYSYWMQHPLQLKKAIEQCQSLSDKTGEEATQCDRVSKAANSVMSLLEEQQSNPELFGEQVMKAEAACVAEGLSNNHASPLDSEVVNKPTACDDVKNKLAVIGLSGPT